MSVPELFGLFKQTHDDKSAEPALSNNSEYASNELSQLNSGSFVNRKLAELAEHKCKERHKVLSYNRCQSEIAFSPEIEIPVHSEIGSPRVVINRAEGMV